MSSCDRVDKVIQLDVPRMSSLDILAWLSLRLFLRLLVVVVPGGEDGSTREEAHSVGTPSADD